MEWLSIEDQDLISNASAVKYSEQLNGKSIVAKLKYNDLDLEWRAVLRDGSL